MFYKFKKDKFFILCQEQKGGTLVTVTREKEPTQTNKTEPTQPNILVQFGLVVPGNLYLLSGTKWTLIDVNTIVSKTRKYHNPLEKAANALSVALTRLPVGDSYLKLDAGEHRLIETLIYDIAINKSITWILPATMYYLGNGKMVAVNTIKTTTKTTQVTTEFHIPQTEWNPRKGLIPIVIPIIPIVIPVIPIIPVTTIPQFLISPAVTPKILMSPLGSTQIRGPIKVTMKVIQKKSVRKKVWKKSTPITKSPITKSVPDFFIMLEKRARWKKEHPNWNEDYDVTKEYGEYLKNQKERTDKDTEIVKEAINKRTIESRRIKDQARDERARQKEIQNAATKQGILIFNDSGILHPDNYPDLEVFIYNDRLYDYRNTPKAKMDKIDTIDTLILNDKGKEEMYQEDDTIEDSTNTLMVEVTEVDIYDDDTVDDSLDTMDDSLDTMDDSFDTMDITEDTVTGVDDTMDITIEDSDSEDTVDDTMDQTIIEDSIQLIDSSIMSMESPMYP